MSQASLNTPPAVLRIVLADDHAIVRQGVRALVDAEPGMLVVGEASNGAEALERARELRPDVVVVDLSMPQMGGAECTERLRREMPQVKIVALTVHEDRGYVTRLLAAGASGYVLKRADAAELIRAIRTAATGGVHVDPMVAAHLLTPGARRSPASGVTSAAALSEREGQVLRLISRGHSYKEISARLGISGKTVETYKARLMEKLDLRSRADIVRFALQQGWLEER